MLRRVARCILAALVQFRSLDASDLRAEATEQSSAYWNLARKDSKQVTIEVHAAAVPAIGVDDEIALSGTPGSKWRVSSELDNDSVRRSLLLTTPSECPHELGALVSRGANGTWEPWAGVYEYKRGFIPMGDQVHEAYTTLLESQDYCTGSAVCKGFCFQLMDNQSQKIPLKSKPSTWILDAHDREYRHVKMRTDFKSRKTIAAQGAGEDGFWWTAIKLDDPRAFCLRLGQAGRTCPESPFACLGLSVDASEAAVKQAFRKLALLHHPDKLGNKVDAETKKKSEEMFRHISEAHDIMLDKRRRMQAVHRQRMIEQQERQRAKQDMDFYSDHRDITTMEPTSYRQFLQISRAWVIHFYNPTLDESQSSKLAYSVAASKVVDEATDILYGAVNCRRYETFCRGKGVKAGTERIVFLVPGEGKRDQYNGRSSSTQLIAWFREVRRPEAVVSEVTSWPPSHEARGSESWVLLFYRATPKRSASCQLCGDGSLPLLRRAAKGLTDAGLRVGHVNCTAVPRICENSGVDLSPYPQHPVALELGTIVGASASWVTIIDPELIPKPWTHEHFVIALDAVAAGATATRSQREGAVGSLARPEL